ncbi:MAG TPA: DNA mismatch repair protein MutS [Candidatus Saccharimonadales bacterium]|nr:DNA mismatch repair protein MutS [Candidatus Saccharimonadales bacterium]
MSEATTPLMQQYNAVKQRYPHALLLFRLGDFYELFYEDAMIASRELRITLTSRNREKGQPIPMCGVPYHAVDGYIARLIRAGFKVAICEQMEQPGPGKKLVRREVSRVITPGTATDVAVLDARENNFLAAVAQDPNGVRNGQVIGLALVDLSTGEFQATEFVGSRAEEMLRDELQLMRPRETLLPRPQQLFETAKNTLLDGTGGVETRLEDWIFQRDYAERVLREQFGVAELTAFGLDEHAQAMCAAGAVVHYLRENAARGDDAPSLEALRHIDQIRFYEQHDALTLDPVSVRNLELLSPIFTEETKGSAPTTLIAALDATVTGMGARLLRSWILRPLIDHDAIEARLDAVAHLLQQTVVRGEIRKELRGIQDLERLTSRITLGQAMPRELVALRKSLAQLPLLRQFTVDSSQSKAAERKSVDPQTGASAPRGSELLRELHDEIDELGDVRDLLERAIGDEPPATANDPGIIRAGYNAELDELRGLSKHSKEIIAAMEERERKRTGIASLKIRYNQVFGYYVEISKPNLHLAPPDYERKQTLVNAERFTFPELKEYERKILAADERILEIERQLFVDVRASIAAQATRLRRTAGAIAKLDVLAAFAKLAADRNYVRPELNVTGELLIVGGRHPVIEELLKAKGERFVPNDLCFETGRQQLLLITGPNMGGKSTYLRQAALIVLMAQMGSYVPARQAKLPLTDRIFTRIGASDNLARGRSTFLVEMSEVATILNHATPASLVLLDEVGRGTATFDGLSIAWAVVEHLQRNTRSRTLFATHYHELTELADLLPTVKNVHVSVKETPNEIIFLRRVEPGSADKSYGIEVARLAGLPKSVIERAREVLKRHEQSEHEVSEALTPGAVDGVNGNGHGQNVMFTALDRSVIERLKAADLDQLKPIEALNLLAELKKEVSNQ